MSVTTQLTIAGFGIALDEKVSRAIELLREHEPADGYYVAFSGGKDSQCILRLCEEAGVRHDAHYHNTTIDPPELVYFIRQHYPNVEWSKPKHSMMWEIAEGRPGTPPTRAGRWCCEIFKEGGGEGRTRVIGVRASESPRRRLLWQEVTQNRNGKDKAVCPIVHWTTDDVWQFIRGRGMPYCKLYDEGFERLGCVGCMLAGPEQQRREFRRWPNFARNWERAIKRNWERHQPPNMRRDGKPYYHASFATAEDFWQWWLSGERRDDPNREGCMSGLLFTNDDEPEATP